MDWDRGLDSVVRRMDSLVRRKFEIPEWYPIPEFEFAGYVELLSYETLALAPLAEHLEYCATRDRCQCFHCLRPAYEALANMSRLTWGPSLLPGNSSRTAE